MRSRGISLFCSRSLARAFSEPPARARASFRSSSQRVVDGGVVRLGDVGHATGSSTAAPLHSPARYSLPGSSMPRSAASVSLTAQ